MICINGLIESDFDGIKFEKCSNLIKESVVQGESWNWTFDGLTFTWNYLFTVAPLIFM